MVLRHIGMMLYFHYRCGEEVDYIEKKTKKGSLECEGKEEDMTKKEGQERLSRWIYSEIKNILELSYRYANKGDDVIVIDYIANNMFLEASRPACLPIVSLTVVCLFLR